jgi:hypothetical protein
MEDLKTEEDSNDDSMVVVGLTLVGQIIACRKLKPRAYISVEQCTACEYHGRYEQVAEENIEKNRPAMFDVICNLPIRIRAENLLSLEGGKDGGTG